jgi:hypothetical protein
MVLDSRNCRKYTKKSDFEEEILWWPRQSIYRPGFPIHDAVRMPNSGTMPAQNNERLHDCRPVDWRQMLQIQARGVQVQSVCHQLSCEDLAPWGAWSWSWIRFLGLLSHWSVSAWGSVSLVVDSILGFNKSLVSEYWAGVVLGHGFRWILLSLSVERSDVGWGRLVSGVVV